MDRAGKCDRKERESAALGTSAGKCGRGERESALVDRAGKCVWRYGGESPAGEMAGQCVWGHGRKVRLLKPAIRVLQNPKWRPIACLNYRVFSDNLCDSTKTSVSVAGGLLVVYWVTMSSNLVTKVYIVSHW